MNTPKQTVRADNPSEKNGSAIWGRLLLGGLDLCLLVSLIVLPLAWLLNPFALHLGPLRLTVHWGWKVLAAPVLLGAVRGFLSSRFSRSHSCAGLWEAPLFKKLCLSIVSVFVVFFAFEQILKVAGFEAHLPPIVIKGEQNQEIGRDGIVADKELRWVFSPGGEFKGWKINSLGFREREVDPVKKPGAIRVICMGCSCTADGGPPYSGELHQFLTNAPPTDAEWEAFNMAMYGYSSVQGLRLFEKRGRALDPDFVTIFFGWNDHWLCGFRPDSNTLAIEMNSWSAQAFEVLRNKRFGQFLIHILTPARNVAVRKFDGEFAPDIEDQYRVPPEEYRQTLTRFVASVRAAGATPILITAPRLPNLTHLLVYNGQAKDLEVVKRVHDEYCDITREVASATGAPLLDLRALFVGEEFEKLFNDDGIHFKQEGLHRIGFELHKKIEEIVRDPKWQSERRARS